MSSNKSAKQKLIQLYGAECFIEKLGLRKPEERHYTSKGQLKRMKKLSYHHILEKSRGGKATVENGALLSVENHAWFHQQSKETQSKINDLFQKYKRCEIELVDENKEEELPFELQLLEIEVTDKIKIEPLSYNRAKVKQETKRACKKYLDEREE